MDPQSNSHLAAVPIEILLRITRNLSTPDLGATRLTCKRIEQALFHSFGHEFFRKKQFMLTDVSLQALIDISQHHALSPLLEHVIIGLDSFASRDSINVDADTAVWLKLEVAKHLRLTQSGGAVKMLVKAFRNLKNLKTVNMRDFNATNRSRDGPHREWTSYGSTTVFEKLGLRMGMYGGGDDYCLKAFNIIIAALAEANTGLENLEFIHRHRSWGLVDYAFALHDKSIVELVSKLRTLHLDVMVDCGTNVDNTLARANPPLVGFLLTRFLSEAKNVTWLRLNFQNSGRYRCDPFLANLGRTDPPLVSAPMTQLQRFDLGWAEASSSAVVDVAARLRSLTSLSIRKVTLYDESDGDDKSNPWADTFRRLAKLPNLRTFSISGVSQKKNRYSHSVCFGRKYNSDYTGHEVGKYLEDLASVTEIWPPLHRNPPVEVSDDDGDSDENTDDDDIDSDEDGEDDD